MPLIEPLVGIESQSLHITNRFRVHKCQEPSCPAPPHTKIKITIMKNCKVCTSQEYFYLFNFFAKLKSSVESKNLKRFRFRKPAEQKEEQCDWILEWRQVWGLVVWKLLKGEQCVCDAWNYGWPALLFLLPLFTPLHSPRRGTCPRLRGAFPWLSLCHVVGNVWRQMTGHSGNISKAQH